MRDERLNNPNIYKNSKVTITDIDNFFEIDPTILSVGNGNIETAVNEIINDEKTKLMNNYLLFIVSSEDISLFEVENIVETIKNDITKENDIIVIFQTDKSLNSDNIEIKLYANNK